MTRRRRARFRLGRSGRWLVVVLLGQGLALGSLALVGPPPAVGIDALWVREHQGLVRVAVVGLMLALLGSLPAIVRPRLRWPVALAWIVTGLVAAVLFDESIVVIVRVVAARVG